MADLIPLTLTEGNDETLAITIDRRYPADDLTLIDRVEFYLKDSDCVADADGHRLSSTDLTQINILGKTAAQITAQVFIPGAWLVAAYPRVYHVDALASGRRRTAIYGRVTVNNV